MDQQENGVKSNSPVPPPRASSRNSIKSKAENGTESPKNGGSRPSSRTSITSKGRKSPRNEEPRTSSRTSTRSKDESDKSAVKADSRPSSRNSNIDKNQGSRASLRSTKENGNQSPKPEKERPSSKASVRSAAGNEDNKKEERSRPSSKTSIHSKLEEEKQQNDEAVAKQEEEKKPEEEVEKELEEKKEEEPAEEVEKESEEKKEEEPAEEVDKESEDKKEEESAEEAQVEENKEEKKEEEELQPEEEKQVEESKEEEKPEEKSEEKKEDETMQEPEEQEQKEEIKQPEEEKATAEPSEKNSDEKPDMNSNQGEGKSEGNGNVAVLAGGAVITKETTQEKENLKRSPSCMETEETVANLIDNLNNRPYDSPDTLADLKVLSGMYWVKKQDTAIVKERRLAIASYFIKYKFISTASKMMIWYNSVGVFKNDNIWFPCYFVYNCLWNYSDSSKELCTELMENDITKLLVANLQHKPYTDNANSKNVLYLLKASLSILQNMGRFPHLIDHLRENGVGPAAEIYINSSIVFLQTLSIMLLSAVVKEGENADKLGGKDVIISQIINFLKKALESSKRRHSGFSPDELLLGLDRLAAYDENKKILLNKDIVPVLTELLSSENFDERQYAAKVLWSLAFDEEGKEIILEQSKTELEILAKKGSDKDSKNAKGCLWILYGNSEEDMKKKLAQQKNQTIQKKIFISYSWAFQDVIVDLSNELKKNGFDIWLDVEQMTGSTLEKMAEGIEESGLIVVALSESYKMSPSCRAEAEYMFKLQKPFVPIMTQRGYKPDGWLGILMGSKFYINFDGKFSFSKALEKLLREINRILDADDSNNQAIVPTTAPSTMAPSFKSEKRNIDEVKTWDKDRINQWIEKENIADLKDFLQDFDGKMLYQLQTVREEVPDFFYKKIDESGLSFTKILKLTSAMDNFV
ncbi:DgyrCDS7375 [Dimorphilus gyrociliatus]|uniref:DgyrCDS7375 n=1 Tax=Dimorphilus gyrociliatus TaxID=2664684 RepID=A0A7I8VSI2_9ANNE|nr:DgyrCDS7375 [Dimorphilus gyrociliatus]